MFEKIEEMSPRGKEWKQDEIIKAFIGIHGNTYDYSKVEYKGVDEPVLIGCKRHPNHPLSNNGIVWFSQTPHHHLARQGCPICRESHMEGEVAKRLSEANIKFEQRKHFDWLPRGYHVDFYLPDYNASIECQGEMHYFPKFGDTELQKQQTRDGIKKQICQSHEMPLYEIFYDKGINEQLQSIISMLNNNNTKKGGNNGGSTPSLAPTQQIRESKTGKYMKRNTKKLNESFSYDDDEVYGNEYGYNARCGYYRNNDMSDNYDEPLHAWGDHMVMNYDPNFHRPLNKQEQQRFALRKKAITPQMEKIKQAWEKQSQERDKMPRNYNESKKKKDMKTINESQLRALIAESINKFHNDRYPSNNQKYFTPQQAEKMGYYRPEYIDDSKPYERWCNGKGQCIYVQRIDPSKEYWKNTGTSGFRKDMKQNKKTINEAQLRAIIKEAVRKSLNEISTDTAIAAHKKAQADLDNMDFRWDDMDARDKYDKRQRQADIFAEYAQENGAAYYPYGVIGWYNDTNEDDLYDRSEVVYGDSIEDVPNEGDGIYALTRDGKETYEQWKEDASAGYDLCYGRMKGLARTIGGSEAKIWDYLTSRSYLSKRIQ